MESRDKKDCDADEGCKWVNDGNNIHCRDICNNNDDCQGRYNDSICINSVCHPSLCVCANDDSYNLDIPQPGTWDPAPANDNTKCYGYHNDMQPRSTCNALNEDQCNSLHMVYNPDLDDHVSLCKWLL